MPKRDAAADPQQEKCAVSKPAKKTRNGSSDSSVFVKDGKCRHTIFRYLTDKKATMVCCNCGAQRRIYRADDGFATATEWKTTTNKEELDA